MIQLLYIHRLERVALVRGDTFLRLLEPGYNLVWTLGRERIRYDLTDPVQAIGVGDPLPADTAGQRVVTVREGEVAVVRVDGVQTELLAPGRYRAWDAVAEVEIHRIDTLARPDPLATSDQLTVGRGRWGEAVTAGRVVAVLLRDGVPVEALAPGRYRAWVGSPWSLARVDLALQVIDLSVQDLLTADQVPVRVRPAASIRVSDPVAWLVEAATAKDQAYTAVQLALREEVATRTLDALLADRDALGRAVLARARALLPEVGVVLEAAAVKDVILPGEVKDQLGKVTVARKEAEAQAIRRREEVATTRQLANTAKLLEKNPILTRLKELEALGELLGKVDKVTLVGGGDLVKNVLSGELRES